MHATEFFSTSWPVAALVLTSILTVVAVKKTPLGHRVLIYLPFVGALCGGIGGSFRKGPVPDPLIDLIGPGILGAFTGGAFASFATLLSLVFMTFWEIVSAVRARQLGQLLRMSFLVAYVPLLAMILGGIIGSLGGQPTEGVGSIWNPTLLGAILGGQIGVGVMTLGLIGVTLAELYRRRSK